MPATTPPTASRPGISLGLDPDVRRQLACRADGRLLVIDYYASRRCAIAVGDLTIGYRDTSPGPGFAELAAVEDVRVLVDERLLDLLADAEPMIGLSGPPFARHLSLSLRRRELWLDFLERPGITRGKGPLRGIWRRATKSGRRPWPARRRTSSSGAKTD